MSDVNSPTKLPFEFEADEEYHDTVWRIALGLTDSDLLGETNTLIGSVRILLAHHSQRVLLARKKGLRKPCIRDWFESSEEDVAIESSEGSDVVDGAI